jgi:hypothetical protein
MPEPRIIKTISDRSICPHCNKQIIISTQMTAPMIDWVLRQEDIEDAKKKLKEELRNIEFKNETNKKQIFEWLDLKETLLSPAEVPIILEQIKKDNEKENNSKEE